MYMIGNIQWTAGCGLPAICLIGLDTSKGIDEELRGSRDELPSYRKNTLFPLLEIEQTAVISTIRLLRTEYLILSPKIGNNTDSPSFRCGRSSESALQTHRIMR
jgi:hypothetical protein